jgi:hypothetical protein
MSRQRHEQVLQILDRSGVEFAIDQGFQSGWPTVAYLDAIDGRERVAFYVAEVGSHSRRDYEMRFQNPAQESQRMINSSVATFAILIGSYRENGQVICVGADGAKRAGSLNRFSVLFNINIIETAKRTGWAEYLSRDDERIIAFHPSLLPIYISYRKIGFEQSTGAISDALVTIGFQPNAVEEIQERGRMATTRIIRDWRFSRDVVQAYEGRCAISGMNWRTVQAAHIFPVSAAGSIDTVQNGLALSPSHHALFDRHKIYIVPSTYQVVFHPELYETANEVEKRFLALTSGALRLPFEQQAKPSIEMLEKRYKYYGGAYDWAA